MKIHRREAIKKMRVLADSGKGGFKSQSLLDEKFGTRLYLWAYVI